MKGCNPDGARPMKLVPVLLASLDGREKDTGRTMAVLSTCEEAVIAITVYQILSVLLNLHYYALLIPQLGWRSCLETDSEVSPSSSILLSLALYRGGIRKSQGLLPIPVH